MEDNRPITVLKALATAGVANPTANLQNAKIIRRDENGTTKVPVDIRKIMEAKAPDVTLQADDLLFEFQRWLAKAPKCRVQVLQNSATFCDV